MENYRKRIVDEILKKKLKGKGAVLIQGPKWCGKQQLLLNKYLKVYYICQNQMKRTKFNIS